LTNCNLNMARSTDRFRFDPGLAALRAAPKEDEQSPTSPCVFDRESYQLLDQSGKDHLTGKCLRSFDNSLDIQLPGRFANRGCGTRRSLSAQTRISFVKLFYFAVGTPTALALTRVAEI